MHLMFYLLLTVIVNDSSYTEADITASMVSFLTSYKNFSTLTYSLAIAFSDCKLT